MIDGSSARFMEEITRGWPTLQDTLALVLAANVPCIFSRGQGILLFSGSCRHRSSAGRVSSG